MRYHAYYLNNSHRDDQVLSYLFSFKSNCKELDFKEISYLVQYYSKDEFGAADFYM